VYVYLITFLVTCFLINVIVEKIEYRTFGLYLSESLLEGLLPEVYLIHWSFFVKAYRILSKQRLRRHEIETADAYLRALIKIHSLLHVATTVYNFGPLRNVSAYPFESINGDLIEVNHATFQPIEQLHTKYSRNIFMRSILHSMRDADGEQFHPQHPFIKFLGKHMDGH